MIVWIFPLRDGYVLRNHAQCLVRLSRPICTIEQLERIQRVDGEGGVGTPILVDEIVEYGSVFPYEQAERLHTSVSLKVKKPC